jgi:excisionase family DNA binding protein
MTTREFDSAVLLNIGEIARITGVYRGTVLRAFESGGVKVLRSGRRYLVEKLAIQKCMPAFYEAMVRKLEDVP